MTISRSLSRPITQPLARAITAAGFGPPPIAVPGDPTIGTATGGNAQASVTFTAPASIGGGPLTSYRVTSSTGPAAAGAGSPIVVTGLTNGVAATFTAAAQNAGGYGPESAASNSVTPTAVVNLITNGTFDDSTAWTGTDGLRAWTISGGVASCASNAGAASLWQTVNFTAGVQYRLTYTVTAISGNLSAYLYDDGGTVGFTNITTTGTFVQTVTATGDSAGVRRLYFGLSGFNSATIDNVILEAV